MPRFWDVFVLLNCVTLSIALVNAVLVPSTMYFGAPNQSTTYDTTAIRNTVNSTIASGQIDSFTASVGLFGMALNFLLNFAGDTLGMYNTMTTIFHIPPVICAWLSGILGIMWLSFFIQLASRMGWGLVRD